MHYWSTQFFRLLPGFSLGNGLLAIAANGLAATIGTDVGTGAATSASQLSLTGGENGGPTEVTLDLLCMAAQSAGYFALVLLIDGRRQLAAAAGSAAAAMPGCPASWLSGQGGEGGGASAAERQAMRRARELE